MTRKPADPSARLALLKAARRRAKSQDVLDMSGMAKACGFTNRNLKLTIDSDPDFPILARGGEGVPYQFDAVAVLDHLIAKCNAVLGDRRKRAAKMARLAGVPELESAAIDDEEPLTAHEVKAAVDAMMSTHKMRQQQGRYLLRDASVAFFTDYHGQLQSETLGLLGKIDPAGEWSPLVRQKVEDAMRTLLVDLQAKMERFIAQPGAPAAS